MRLLTIITVFSAALLYASPDLSAQEDARTRLVILADMGCEPDEVQQMIHMLICSNEFEPERLF